MRTTSVALLLMLSMWGASLTSAIAAPALALQARSPSVAVGDTILVDVNLSGDPAGLNYFHVTVGFDGAVVSWTSTLYPSELSGWSTLDETVAGSTYGVTRYTLTPGGLAGTLPGGTLMTLSFAANAVGTASFALDPGIPLAPGNTLAFSPNVSSTIVPDIADGQASVRVVASNRVPEPGAIGLVGVAFLLMTVFGRGSRRA
ncbi:MAG: hypothetical protein GC151_02055 [Betaproteobacteria bacterium]|nr:hypothetical protein [Betaproteobacteria bacterium]